MIKKPVKIIISILDDHYINKYGLPNTYENKSIVLYDDRFSHFAKHKQEFSSEESYKISILNINTIIQNPDFICFNEKNKSLEFVKRMVDNTLVAVRVSQSNELKIKTLYPINDTKKEKLKAKAYRKKSEQFTKKRQNTAK